MRCKVLLFLLLVSICLLSFCAPMKSRVPSDVLSISRVSTDSWGFYPPMGETIVIRYHLSQAAEVSVRVFDTRNILIRNLIREKTQPAGDRKAVWDGKDEAGEPVPPGLYLYTIYACNERGEETLFDVTDITGGQVQIARAVTYNHSEKTVSYVLPKPGLVNIRVGLKDGGPLIGTLLDWVPRPAGLNTESWDGYDSNRTIQIGKNPHLEIGVNAYTLNSNSIAVLNETPLNRPEFVEQISWAKTVRKKIRQPKKRMYHHWQHPRDRCRDPQIEISFPDASLGEGGVPVISGKTPIRFDISSEDRELMIGERFEIVIYTDLIFVYEEELGYSPFTWTWDLVGVNPGTHYITVMFRGYEGHFGTATAKVWVR